MKKSSMVKIFLLTLATLSCDEDNIKQCVNEKGIVVPERFCDLKKNADGGINLASMSPEEKHYYQTVILPQGPSYVPIYRWHYDTVYVAPGNAVWRGSYTPSPGRIYPGSSIGISRGGFGAIGKSFSFSGAS